MPLDQIDQMDSMESQGPGPIYPASLPPTCLSLANWRRKLRSAIYDELDTDPVDPGNESNVVVSDTELIDAYYNAAGVMGVYRPQIKAQPPLVLVGNQALYYLPFDFLAPEQNSWDCLIGPNGFLNGTFWGSRYGWLMYQSGLNAPWPPRGANGIGVFGMGYWPFGVGLTITGLPPVEYDTDGNILAGVLAGTGFQDTQFYPASGQYPYPSFVVNPPPARGMTFSHLKYYACQSILRLQSTDGNTWDTNADGSYVATPVYDGQQTSDVTDIISIAPGSDDVRLSLLYAKHWTLNEIVLSKSGVDEERWAYYSIKTGKAREDVMKMSQDALDQFEKRTRLRAYGTTG